MSMRIITPIVASTAMYLSGCGALSALNLSGTIPDPTFTGAFTNTGGTTPGGTGGSTGGSATTNTNALTQTQLLSLTSGQVQGSLATSPDGRLLAFSDGRNIFTLDLSNPNAAPVQITNTTSAFSPAFLSNGTLVFGSIERTSPNAISFFAISPQARNGIPAPTLFQTLDASQLGFATGSAIGVPQQFQFNSAGNIATAVINNQPFLLDFTQTPVRATALNTALNGFVTNPVLSPNGTQLAFTNANGQIVTANVVNGIVSPGNLQVVGAGDFPAFTNTNQLAFFGNDEFSLANSTASFNNFALGNPALVPGDFTFATNSGSFFMTNPTGTGIVQASIPGTATPTGLFTSPGG